MVTCIDSATVDILERGDYETCTGQNCPKFGDLPFHCDRTTILGWHKKKRVWTMSSRLCLKLANFVFSIFLTLEHIAANLGVSLEKWGIRISFADYPVPGAVF